MRDVWKSALDWYIYLSDKDRKGKYAVVITAVKDELNGIDNKGDLVQHYMSTDGLCEGVVARLFPAEAWFDYRRLEDVAYGLRSLELSTGKKIDVRQRMPSRWLIETAA